VLYGLVREHLATFLAETERSYAAPLPKYVVDTFDDYLACGDVAGGFLRCHCEGCRHDVLVAFSCKHRGLCPSCGARRMCNEAVQLVDRVLPNVPVRQWVLSLPWELRRLAAMKPGVIGAMDRIFSEEIARLTRRLAGIDGAQTGSVGCPQMFGGSLNLHVHFHTIAADGVFEKTDAGGVRFHEAPPSSRDDVAEVAQRVRDRALRWLRRHGHLVALPAGAVVAVAPTMISVAHWGRLEEGALFAWSRRLEWAVMMKRTFGFNVLRCPRCSGKMRVLSTITEPPVVRQILDHLGVRASPLPRAPARDPDWEQIDLGFAADAA